LPVYLARFALAVILAASSLLAGVPAPTAAGVGQKVVIIVGPIGTETNSYRAKADSIATTAAATGATVVKVYSPDATWENVRAAVNGANVVVYLGHGNGYPNPYSSGAELTDRVNGWGLNRVAGVDPDDPTGDGDDWSKNMVYCGEKALLGTLTSADGALQRQYCSGGPIAPAPGFVMVYSNACYTPGAGEGWDTPATEEIAVTRVASYSRPMLQLGAGAYFATDLGAGKIVEAVLTNPTVAFGHLFTQGNGYSESALRIHPHPHASNRQIWIQRTNGPGSKLDYWYAFSGDPTRSPSGAKTDYIAPQLSVPFSDILGSPFSSSILWLASSGITAGCAPGRFCPRETVTREQMASFLVRGLKLPHTSTDFFTDDNGSPHQGDINRLAASGITGGCAPGRFCPRETVTREQMASFLVRGLKLPWTGTDYFTDDNGSPHEGDINRLAASGITGGCAPGRFCPGSVITREQMAAFLHRAFDR
jgi:hypothetical protein